MPKDFKSSQIRTNKLIASRSEDNQPGLLIYSASKATDFSGGTGSGFLTGVGTDVFFFISGSKETASQDSSARKDITLFGGDVVVSGTMYMETLVAEVDMSTTGSATIEGPLYVTQSATIYQGLTVNESGEAGDYADFRVESDGEDEALFVDASANIFYVNKGETAFTTIIGSTNDEALRVGSAGVILNEDGHATNDFRVESDNDTHILFVDAGNDAVSIGVSTDAPASVLEVAGDSGQGKSTFRVVHTDADQVAAEIFADSNTTATGLAISADALTTGNALEVTSTSNNLSDGALAVFSYGGTSDNINSLVQIVDNNTTANKTTALEVIGKSSFDLSTSGSLVKFIQYASDTNDAILTLENTNGGATSRPALNFYKSSETTNDGGYLGEINFVGMNDSPDGPYAFATIRALSADVTETSIDGEMTFELRQGGGIHEILSLGGVPTPEVHINAASRTVNFRVDSNNKTHAIMVSGSSDQVIFLSSSAVPNGDVSFFVSGSVGDRLESKGGVSLFGGDLVTSGNMNVLDDLWVSDNTYVSGSLVVADYIKHGGDEDTYLLFAPDTLTGFVGGWNWLNVTESVKDTIYLGSDGDRVLIMSGTSDGGDTPNPYAPMGGGMADVNFWVSGSVGSLGTDVRGTSNFGGDLVVSGNMRVGASSYSKGSADVLRIDSNHVTTGRIVQIYGGALQTGRLFNAESDSSDPKARTLVQFTNDHASAVGARVLHILNNAIPSSVEGKASVLIEGTTNSDAAGLEIRNTHAGSSSNAVLVLSSSVGVAGTDDASIGKILFRSQDSSGVSNDYADISAYSTDVTNGTEGGAIVMFAHVGGSRVQLLDIGGWDAAASKGANVVVNEGSADVDFRVESNNKSAAILVDGGTDQIAILSDGVTAANAYIDTVASTARALPSDIALWVSGAVGTQGSSTKGVSVFAGDVLASGTLYVDTINNTIPAFSAGYNLGVSNIAGSDTVFVVSGAIGDRGNTSGVRGTAVFGGDTVVSGVLLVGSDDFQQYAGSYVGGTISGSIHHTSGGISYIKPGDYVTVVSASSGQITIGVDTDGAGLVTTDGTGTDNEIAIWTGTNEVEGSARLTFDGSTFTVGASATTSTDLRGAVTINEESQDVDFRVESNNKAGAILLDGGTDQMVLLGAGTAASNAYFDITSATGRALPGDIALYVSGAIGGKDSVSGVNAKGTAVFGGDVLASGSVYLANSTNYMAGMLARFEDADVNLNLAANTATLSANTVAVQLDGASAQKSITINSNGMDADFIINAGEGGLGTYKSLITGIAQNANERVLILSGGDYSGNSPNEGAYGDTNFFVSGAIGSRGSSVLGTSLFGGDVVVSGSTHVLDTMYVANDVHLTDDLYVSGNVNVAEYIYHGSDPDTYIRLSLDEMNFQAGGIDFLKFDEDSTNVIVFNEGAADVDFRVESSGEDEAIFLDAGSNTLYINKGETAFTTVIGNTNDEAIRVGAAGVIFNEDGHATNDFRVETDNRTHGLFVDGGNNASYFGSVIENSDVSFFVSGGLNDQGRTGYRATSLFGGDLVVSGILYAFGSNNNLPAAAIGSLDDASGIGSDAHLWVSGNIGSKGGERRGVSIFGGDTVVSGGLYLEEIEAPGAVPDGTVALYGKDSSGVTKLYFKNEDGETEVGSGGGGSSGGGSEKGWTASGAGTISTTGSIVVGHNSATAGNADIFLGSDGAAVFNEQSSNVDFRIEGNNSTHLFFADGSEDAILINAGTLPGEDTTFFVSGAIGKRGEHEPGTSVIGGDLAISGTLVALRSGDGAHAGILIDKDYTGTTDVGSLASGGTDATGLTVDYDVTGVVASGQTAHHDAIAVHYNQDAPTHVGTVNATGADIRMTGGTSGVQAMKGVAINLAGADTNTGIDVTVPNDSTHFIARSPDALLDFFSISVGESGATTVSTSDQHASVANLTLDADGKIIIEAVAGDEVVFNEASNDVDFRVESDNNTHALFINGATDSALFNASTAGVDVSFFVSGSTNLSDRHSASGGVALFGGNVVTSGSIVPGVHNSVDLGSSDNRWRNIYTGDLHLKNDRGDWTVVEEEDYLSVRNNKTGKRFKFVLEEIED